MKQTPEQELAEKQMEVEFGVAMVSLTILR